MRKKSVYFERLEPYDTKKFSPQKCQGYIFNKNYSTAKIYFCVFVL